MVRECTCKARNVPRVSCAYDNLDSHPSILVSGRRVPLELGRTERRATADGSFPSAAHDSPSDQLSCLQ